MALMKNLPMGRPVGTIGNTVYRTRYGKTFAYSRPTKMKISYSPKSVENRNRFTVFSHILQAFRRMPYLKEIWLLKNLERPLFAKSKPTLVERFNQANHERYFKSNDITLLYLAPFRTNNLLINKEVLVNDNTIKITVNIPEFISGIDEEVLNNITPFGIIELKNPGNPAYPDIAFVPLIIAAKYKSDNDLIFTFTLYDNDYKYFSNYTVRNFVMNVYIKDFCHQAHFFTANIGGSI